MPGFISIVLLLALMLTVGIFRFGPLFREAGCARLGIILMVGLCVCGVPSFFAVISFAEAEPANEIRANGYDIPPHWTAGVMNHGSYYRWYTIKDRPLLFALSVVVLVISVVPLQGLLVYSWWKRWRAS